MFKNILVGTAIGVSASFLAPFAVGLFGFTAGGITAGSTAASMMSSAAIAAGGSVPAGGTVAILQSIGAAGLGFSTKVAIGATSAAVAASVKK